MRERSVPAHAPQAALRNPPHRLGSSVIGDTPCHQGYSSRLSVVWLEEYPRPVSEEAPREPLAPGGRVTRHGSDASVVLRGGPPRDRAGAGGDPGPGRRGGAPR